MALPSGLKDIEQGPETCFLLNLPNEILAEITDYVSPDDIANFASCHPLFQSMARQQRLVEHKEFQRKHVGAHYWFDSYSSLYLLLALQSNPRIAFYIKQLTIDSCEENWANRHLLEHGIADRKVLLQSLRPLIQKCRFLSEDEKTEWSLAMLGGHEGPLIALLVSRLPHLQVLTIHYRVERLCLEYLVPELVDTSRYDYKPQVLGKLTALYLEPSENSLPPYRYRPLNLLKLVPFTTLPTIRYIGTTAKKVSSLPYNRSGLTKFELLDRAIKLADLSALLKGVAALEIFDIKHCYPERCWTGSYDIYEILSKYTTHSLKELRLHQSNLFIRSLKEFNALRHVEINMILLSTVDDQNRFQKLVDIMPHSIEKIELLETGPMHPCHIVPIFEKFDSVHLPKLQLTEIHTYFMHCRLRKAAVRDILEGVYGWSECEDYEDSFQFRIDNPCLRSDSPCTCINNPCAYVCLPSRIYTATRTYFFLPITLSRHNVGRDF